MTTGSSMRFLIVLLLTLTLGSSTAGCILDDVPPEDIALVGLNWFKDLIIGDKIRLDFTTPDGCYQNGVKVDCATMVP